MQENEPLSQTRLGLHPRAGPQREQAEDFAHAEQGMALLAVRLVGEEEA